MDHLKKNLQIRHFSSTYITEQIERKNFAVGVYLDLAKAYDTVHHRKLLDTLEGVGMKGNLLRWFAAYLEGRTHRVKVNGVLSEELSIKYGVPQGSVLGPILFIMYINPLFSLHLKGLALGYVDDISLVYLSLIHI